MKFFPNLSTYTPSGDIQPINPTTFPPNVSHALIAPLDTPMLKMGNDILNNHKVNKTLARLFCRVARRQEACQAKVEFDALLDSYTSLLACTWPPAEPPPPFDNLPSVMTGTTHLVNDAKSDKSSNSVIFFNPVNSLFEPPLLDSQSVSSLESDYSMVQWLWNSRQAYNNHFEIEMVTSGHDTSPHVKMSILSLPPSIYHWLLMTWVHHLPDLL